MPQVLMSKKNRHPHRRKFSGRFRGRNVHRLLGMVIAMIATARVILQRQTATTTTSLLRIPLVDGLVSRSKACSFVRQGGSRLVADPRLLYRQQQQPTRTTHSLGRPLATAFVTPPEIASGEEFHEDDDDEDNEFLACEEDAFGGNDAGASDAAAQKLLLLEGLNPSQVEAVTQPLRAEPSDGNSPPSSIVTRVIAGPGSGKTKVLTTRIAHLLHEDPYGRVLAVTFTRKAAGEMKERLETLLRDQERGAVGHGGAEISAEDASGAPDAEGSIPPRGIERVELGTFHSICAKILRFNGDLLRDLPSVRRDMSRAEPVWVEKLQPPGADANNQDDEDNDGTKPEMVLVDPEINLNGQYAIVDQAEQIRILNECLKEQEIDLKGTDLKPIQILTAVGKMKEMFAQGQDPFVDRKKRNGMGGAGAALRTARKVYHPYREKLLSNNAVDFDDLILLTREMLTEHTELRERLHRRWPHVLVDEYQDTSKIQMDLVKLLTSSSLFVVGDADQSIYSWRGAHVGSLEEVATEFEDYGTVRTVFLKENYRSTSNIVRAAEKVISSNPLPLSVLLADSGVSDKALDKIEGGATNSSKQDDLRRAMKPKRGAGPSPRVVACEDERAEAKFVVDTVLNMTAHNDIAPGDTVAMIYRTNAQSRYLEEACVQQNLPYVIRGGAGGFYKRAEIKDCLCFLRWLSNGNDEGSMMRAMKTPSKGIGEKAYREFKEYCEIVTTHYRQNFPDEERPTCLDVLISMTNTGGGEDFQLPEGVPLAEAHMTKRALNNFVKFSSKMRAIRSKAHNADVGKLLFFIIEELELMAHFDAISKSRSEFQERKENVQELRNAAKKYASYGPAIGGSPPSQTSGEEDFIGEEYESALSNFLDDVALVSDTAEANEETDNEESNRLVVNLMTIHASKGTEFDCVFVVGLEEGTLPCQPALAEGPGSVQLEEEKRLCYVAMTRAKTRLILTWRKEVTGFSNWSDSGPNTVKKQRSRFLNAIVSKKSLKKNKKKKSPGYASSVRNASTAAAKRSVGSRGLNRSGLLGAEAQRNLDRRRSSRRQELSSSTSRAFARRRKSTSKNSQEPQESFAQSLEGIEALRSNLKSSSKVTEPPRRRRQQQPKATAQRKKSTSGRRATPKDLVDPAWFFPVGQRVVHKNLGKGIVVEPPPFQKIEDSKVRVKFSNGKTLDFPALGSDILPDMGNF